MCVHHLLVGGFEVAVLADIGPLNTVLSHMLLHLFPGDGLLAVEGTLGVHILAVVLVRVQVSVQLRYCKNPAMITAESGIIPQTKPDTLL